MVDDQTDKSWESVPVNEEDPTQGQANRGVPAELAESAAEQGAIPVASGEPGVSGFGSATPSLAEAAVGGDRTAPIPQTTAQDPVWTASAPQSPWARPGTGATAWSAPDPAALVTPAAVPPAAVPPAGVPTAGYGYPTQAYPQSYQPGAYPYPNQTQVYPPGYLGGGYPQQGYQPGAAGYVQPDAQTTESGTATPSGTFPQPGFGGGNPPGGGYPPNGSYPYGSYSGGYYPPQPYYQPNQPTPKRSRRWTAIVAAIAAFLLIATGAYWANGGIQGASESPQVQVPSGQSGTGQSGTGQQDQGTGSGEDGQSGQSGDQQGSSDQSSAASSEVTTAEAKGVVLIEGETSSGTAAGTGMILSSDGKVLTNYHVVAGTDKVAVKVPATGSTYVATVLGFDQTKDVALLQLQDASNLETVTIDTDSVTTGEAVTAVGNAEGGGVLVAAAGKVTGLDRSLRVSSDSPWGNFEDLSGLIQTTAGAVPGHSGGPMFDSDAEVVGITTAGSTKAGTSYAVPIATALSVVSQIETGSDAGTVRVGPAGFLGVQPSSQDVTGNGVTIVKVVSGSPAAKAGVTAGSRLTKVGDTKITTGTNVAMVIRSLEPGEKVTITWITPSGNTKTATVTLGSSTVN